jgi:hypothetical protein
LKGTTALVLTVVALGAARPAWAEDSPKITAATSHWWTICGAADGLVRVEASDGTVLEAPRLKYRMPCRASGGDIRWCSIEGRPDGTMLVKIDKPGIDGNAACHKAQAKLVLIDLKAGSVYLGPGHINLEPASRRH